MSWDVLFQDLPKNIISMEEIDENFVPEMLCTKNYYVKMMKTLFQNADYTDLSWITIEEDEYFIEFNSGSNEEIESLMLHIKGKKVPIEIIKKIVEYTGWKAIDASENEIMDLENYEFNDEEFEDMKIKVIRKKWWEFWKLH